MVSTISQAAKDCHSRYSRGEFENSTQSDPEPTGEANVQSVGLLLELELGVGSR